MKRLALIVAIISLLLPVTARADVAARPNNFSASYAKDLLCMPHDGTYMTGYTPTACSYFKQAGRYGATPHVGDIVYFYSASKGRIAHVGIVESIDTNTQTFVSIEGNKVENPYSSFADAVAEGTYSYAAVGNENHVDGFGTPDFESIHTTPDRLVSIAKSYLGYVEKSSADDLSNWSETTGSDNYNMFEPEIDGKNGVSWCQYFVDFCAVQTYIDTQD